MLGLLELLVGRGFSPDPSKVKLVRHKDKRFDLEQWLGTPLFDRYQAFQSKPVFRECTHIVVLLGEDGTKCRLVGVYAVGPEHPAREYATAADNTTFGFITDEHVFYDLKKLPGFADLEGRVVVEWGKAALSWHQWFSDREVVEIRQSGRFLPSFTDYLDVNLTHDDLRRLVESPAAHPDWLAGLKAVGGVYLIVSAENGAQYVGSATGIEGIWGRWKDYAVSGHGGNDALIALCHGNNTYPGAFQFSILNTFSRTTTVAEALTRESRFKLKLGTRAVCLAPGLVLNKN